MTTKFTKHVLATAVAGCLVLPTMPVIARAQTQTATQGPLEEVVVTARKRPESILKVPVNVTAISADKLGQFAITDIKGIANQVPGLNFGAAPAAAGVLVSLRGLGTSSNNPTVDQSVALVVDGMQFTQGLAYGAAMFDMASVQVMKGPQALFFGKAAPAGVIDVKTKDPTDQFEITASGGYETEAKQKRGTFIISGPVTDTLGMRLAYQYSTMSGYFENVAKPSTNVGGLGAAPVTHKHFPDQSTTLLRGTAVWQPTDSFKARLKLNYSSMNSEGNGGEPQYISCPEGPNANFTGALAALPAILGSSVPINFIGSADCNLDKKYRYVYMNPADYPGIYNNGVPFLEVDQYFGTLELNYDLNPSLTLSSVTGYYNVGQKSTMNGGVQTDYGTPFAIQAKLGRDDFTQEVRLTSDYDTPVNFTVGAFYQRGQTDYLNRLPFNQTWAPLTAVTFGYLPAALVYQDNNLDANAVSFFGQVLWDIVPNLELGVGARWTNENRKLDVINQMSIPASAAGPAVPSGPVPLANRKLGSTNWSPELTLTWTPTDWLTLYGNLKQAYKSGSFDVAAGANPGDNVSFKDEKVRGGEIGLKSRLFGDTLAINTAGYYYKYDNLQVERNVFSPFNGQVGVQTTNAATANIYGVDFDLTYAPPVVTGLTLTAAVNWNHAEYGQFRNAPCYYGQSISQGCNRVLDPVTNAYTAQDLSGQPLLRAPKWSANLGINYQFPILNNMTLQLGSNTTFSSKYSTSIDNWKYAYQGDYIKTSANVALSGANDRWKVEVIGDNLTDKLTYGKCNPVSFAQSLLIGPRFAGTGTNATPFGGPETACYVDRGRAVWLRLTVKLL